MRSCLERLFGRKKADVAPGIEMRRLQQEIAIAYDVKPLSETMRAVPDNVVMTINPLNVKIACTDVRSLPVSL
jgi:hypothetical protein